MTPLRIYRLTATATLNGIDQYRIVTDVQAGQSFARFSSYVDEKQPLPPGGIWYDFIVDGESRYTGPIHKNDPVSFRVTDALLNSSVPPAHKPFNSLITTSSGTNLWNQSTTFPRSRSRYNNLFTNGEADLLYKVPPRPLPENSHALASAAWGGVNPPLGSGPGVSIPPAGGVYIQGDVVSMDMGVNGVDHFTLTIVQIHTDSDGNTYPVTTIIEENLTTNERIASRPDGTILSSAPLHEESSVIFTTGNILSLKGTNKGPHTIATRFDLLDATNPIKNKSIEISGDILRNDTTKGSDPAVTDDRLGIVSNRIWIADNSVLPRSIGNTLFIYAHLTATDTFAVKGYRGPTTPSEYFPSTAPPGSMAIYGGLATRFPWRTMHTIDSNFAVQHGYGAPSGYGSAPIHYDKLLVNDPPPMYPTTAGTELMVRSWREFPL